MVRLGDKVKDNITGFTGIVTAECKHITGEIRYMVENMDDTNRPIEWWFDESRLTKIKED